MKALPLIVILSFLLTRYIYSLSKRADQRRGINLASGLDRLLFLMTFVLSTIAIDVSLNAIGQHHVYTDEKVPVTTQQLVGFDVDGEQKFVLRELAGTRADLTTYMYDSWGSVTERHLDLSANRTSVEFIYDDNSVPQFETHGMASRNKTGKPLFEWIFPLFPKGVHNLSYVFRLPESAVVTITRP